MIGQHITRRRVLGTATGLVLVPVGVSTGQESEWLFEASPIIGAKPLDDGIAIVGRGGGVTSSLWGVGLFDLREQRMRWWVDTENRMIADLLVHDGAIVAASERGAIKIDVDTGEVLWRHEYRGQLKDIVQVGSDLLLIGNDRSETAVTRLSIHDGESDSEYRFPEFGRVQIATGRGINSVAIASDRYVGILDSSDGSISWGVEYGGFALEWVYPVAPNILATLLDSRLVFIWDKRYSREIETQIPKIRGVVQTDDQLLFAYGERSISCIDWTAREILWERQRDETITSVTPDESGGGVVVARNNGFIIGHTSSGIPSVIGRISGSANLGVYNTASYLAWGDRNRGIRLVSNSLESKDDPSQTTLQITDVPRSNVNTAIVKGVLAGILMMAGLAGAKELLQFGLADGRPFGRFELGERRFAAILALVGGTFGAHKFYQGRETIAIYNLMLFWTGLPTLLGIYECVTYLRFSDSEYQKHLENLAERDQSLEGD